MFGAIFGCVCAVAFTLTPFLAGADAGPVKVSAPKISAPAPDANPAPVKKHMNRGHVGKYDDGCG